MFPPLASRSFFLPPCPRPEHCPSLCWSVAASSQLAVSPWLLSRKESAGSQVPLSEEEGEEVEKMPWCPEGRRSQGGVGGGGGGIWPAPRAPASACMDRCWERERAQSPKALHPLSLPAPAPPPFLPLPVSPGPWPQHPLAPRYSFFLIRRRLWAWFFCAHRCRLPCACPVQGEQGARRGLWARAAKPHRRQPLRIFVLPSQSSGTAFWPPRHPV